MLIRTTRPAGAVADMDPLRAAVRAQGMEDDDDLLTDLLAAQTRRYEDFCGRVMLPTGFEARFEAGCRMLVLPVSPIREIDGIACLDSTGAEIPVPDEDWIVLEGENDWTVLMMSDAALPDSGASPLPLRVRFSAGYLSAEEAADSGYPARLYPDPADRRNILALTRWSYDRDEEMPEEIMRKSMGHRRVFR